MSRSCPAKEMWRMIGQTQSDPEKMRQIRARDAAKKKENPTLTDIVKEEVAKARKKWLEELYVRETMMVRKKLAVSLQLPSLGKSMSEYYLHANVEGVSLSTT
eukprot:1420514-Pleurochrysis_carterae.AAC.1